MMAMVMPRAVASAWTRSIWWLLPSTGQDGCVVDDAGGQPLVGRLRPGWTGFGLADHLGRGPWCRGRRPRPPRPAVCGCAFRPWTIGWPVSRWWPRRLSRWPGAASPGASRCPCRRRRAPAPAQGRRAPEAVGVEFSSIDRGAGGQGLGLSFADRLSGGPSDRRRGLVERSPGCLDRGQPPQPVRVTLGGQVEQPIAGTQIGVPACKGNRVTCTCPRSWRAGGRARVRPRGARRPQHRRPRRCARASHADPTGPGTVAAADPGPGNPAVPRVRRGRSAAAWSPSTQPSRSSKLAREASNTAAAASPVLTGDPPCAPAKPPRRPRHRARPCSASVSSRARASS